MSGQRETARGTLNGRSSIEPGLAMARSRQRSALFLLPGGSLLINDWLPLALL